MNNTWILAKADGTDASSGITSEPITSQGQTSTTAPGNVAADPNAASGTAARKPFGGSSQWIFIGLMFVMMYFIIFRAPRKKQQQHKQMVQALEKNDKVRTIGGIIGTVVDIKGEEVILKVDESNNTKIRVASSAIGRNLSKDNG